MENLRLISRSFVLDRFLRFDDDRELAYVMHENSFFFCYAYPRPLHKLVSARYLAIF